MIRNRVKFSGFVLAFVILLWLFSEGQRVRIEQIPQPLYQVYLPMVSRSPDARFGTQTGWGADTCGMTHTLLNMSCGNQHQLIDDAELVTFGHLEWYIFWNIVPPHPCLWDGTQSKIVDIVKCAEWVTARPGKVWVIGNEYDCGVQCGGGSLSATQYAMMYHAATTLIKANDPTAYLVTSGYASSMCAGWAGTVGAFIAEHRRLYGEPRPDAWGYHTYQSWKFDEPDSINGLNCLIQNLRAAGISPSIYITEFGWSGYDTVGDTPENSIAFMRWYIPQLKAIPEVKKALWWEWGAGSQLFIGDQLTEVGKAYLELAQ